MSLTEVIDRHPCAFTPGGADQEFCQRQSKLLRNAERCSGCASPWRICLKCVSEQAVDPGSSVVVDAERGLCERHAGPRPASEVLETERDLQVGKLAKSGDAIVEIELGKIRPRKDQPRQHFDEDELQELAKGLKRLGQQQPVLVVPIESDEDGSEYELDDGERRWRAAHIAGLKRLRCIIISEHLDDGLRFLRSAAANFNRSGHTLLEEVDMVVRLHEKEGFTQKVIAEALGKNAMWVTQRYSLRRLHPEVRAMLAPDAPPERKLSFPAALRLAVLQPDVQKQVAPSVVRVTANELTHVINSAARAGGFAIDRRSRAPSDDFRSIMRNTKGAADRVRLIAEMDPEDWENAFRHQNRSNLEALSEQLRRLEKHSQRAIRRLREQMESGGS